MKSCTRIAATVLLGLAGALVTAACVQGSPPAPEAEGTLTLATEDEDDPFGGDPDVGGSIGSDAPAWDEGSDAPVSSPVNAQGEPGSNVSGKLEQDTCIAAGKAGFETRRAFCNSALVSPEKKQGCWQHLLLTRAEWIGWCYWNF